ncbi:MAG TPA: amino acid adenylation domain-containing protein [Actinophytocola sp.]|uniref:non-ribosomal peptide synthetase n=1 Tax=Actinophytocola sp. TaxID=1872138 RepID=UPI002DFA0DC5|nr:non-ribosomal peptide synthetase [Actinophytocola sp.]HEV8562024.1 amino acid adenylation domain-containing protein [Actinophytocola sp.]
MSVETRNENVAGYVFELVREIQLGQGTDPVSRPDESLHLDSLAGVELKAAMESDLAVELELADLLECRTVEDITEFVTRELAGDADGGARPAAVLPAVVPDPGARFEPFGLTDLQQAYLLGREDFYELGNVSAAFYAEVDVVGVDLARLESALHQVIARHGMLRAVMLPDGRQRVLEDVPPYRIGLVDLSTLPEPERAETLARAREELSTQILPADRWPLFDIRAHHLDGRRTRLHLYFDLLAIDATSLKLVVAEWVASYLDDGFVLPEPELSFRDYVVAVESLTAGPAFERARGYWLRRLDELPPAPELPLAVAPGTVRRPRFARRGFRMDAEQWARLRLRAAEAGLTPAMLLCAAYSEVLGCWSASPRFTLNVTVSGRLPVHPQIGLVLGDFTSLTPLACDLAAGASFRDRATKLQRQFRTDFDHRMFSGVRVMRELARGGGANRAAMPVVFTSVLGEGFGADALPPWFDDLAYSIAQVPQVHLENQVFEVGGVLHVNWDAVEELFPQGLLDAMFAAYQRLLVELAADGSVWDRDRLGLVPDTDLWMWEWVNDTAGPVPARRLHELMDRAVAERDGEPAVIDGDRVLTYAELDERATRIAHRLRALGVRPNQLVAVVMVKGWEQIVAALGILRSGAAYLPVDAGLPAQRIARLLETGRVSVALTQSGVDERISWPDGVRPLRVDDDAVWARESTRPLRPVQTLDDLAYVIFTSGSTGQPKGVMIDHCGAVNTVTDINGRHGIGPGDRVLALSSLSFDLSIYDVFGILAAGGTIVLPDPDRARDPGHWAELMARHRVSVWNTVPALMQMLVDHAGGQRQPWAEHLRLALLSGDWIPVSLPDRLRALADPIEIISLGGATEASIWSIAYPIDEVDPDWVSIPYGCPLTNQTYHVLDHRLAPRPAWAPGELYIGGTGVAQGYWADPERTAASFITHPETGERLYRTGDLGRYLPDGTIEFLGRTDTQVKINGYRIELGEIEATLAGHPRVRDAVVTTHGSQLHAYLTPALDAVSTVDSAAQVGNWELVFDEIRDGAGEAADGEFAGWNSSYTGKPLPVGHMADWAGATVERIRALGGREVLEIGCGSGILVRRLLPGCDRYIGTDLSGRTLRDLAGMLDPALADRVELHHVGAHDAASVVRRSVDVVVINSVAQYFPDVAYLLRVIESVVPLVRPGGAIFVGDVRNLRLHRVFACSVELERAAADLPDDELARRVHARLAAEPELLVAPELFLALLGEYADIAGVDILPRLDRHDTEMSRFRYDAVLRVVRQPEPLPVDTWIDVHGRDFDDESLTAILNGGPVTSFGLAGVPNAWTVRDAEALRLMELGLGYSVAELSEAAEGRAIRGITPGAVCALAAELGWATFPSWVKSYEDGAFDVVFRRDGRTGRHDFGAVPTGADLSRYTNDPRAARVRGALEREARAWAADRLPAYMLPSGYMILDSLPLTGNGKVDRAALPAPQLVRDGHDAVAPRGETEIALAEVFGQVLGLRQIGVHSGFFELGGDSIMAVRLVAAAGERGLEFSLSEFFANPTVAGLAELVDGRATGGEVLSLPVPAPDPGAELEPFGLTDLQQAYLLGRNGFYELNAATNFYAEVDLVDVDLARLETALAKVIARHGMLRAVILPDGRQRVLAEVPPYRLDMVDLSGLPEPERAEALTEARERLSTQILPTDRWPLFDIRAHRVDAHRTRLHIAVDLLIFDGSSLGIFIAELFASYQDGALALPVLELSFRDYVVGVESFESDPAFERARDYWLRRLDELPAAPELPLAFAPGQVERPRFVRREFRLDAPRWTSLQQRAAAAGLTPSMVLCAAYAEVLGCWSATPRFTVNVTVSGRLPVHPQVGQVLGDFTSLILLAFDTDAGSGFAERASAAQRQFWSDFDHRLFSGVRVMRELARTGGTARASMPVVFTSVLGDANLDAAAQIGDLVHTSVHTPQVYLDHQVFEVAGELRVNWDAIEELFPQGLLDAMFSAFERLVHRLADDESAWRPGELDLVPANDLETWARVNDTAGPRPSLLLHESMEWAVSALPYNAAVIDGDRVLTYLELDERATRIGHRLRAAGVRPNQLVAVVMDKGWEQVVGTLGVLRSGGAYLPVDPALPARRIARLLEDGQVTTVLTQSTVDDRIEWPDGIRRYRVDDDAVWARESIAYLPRVAAAEDLAYVIFTSGSTGRPKGVMIDHRGAANTVADINRRFRVGPGDRVLALSSLSFDLSVYDVFGILAAGGTIVLPDPDRARDPGHWAELMVRYRVSVWNTVPALLRLLVDHAGGRRPPWAEHLRLALLSGDWIPVPLPDRLRALADPVEIVSLGGATEASIWSVAHPIGAVDPDWVSIPYGCPLTNQTCHVLDHRLRPRPAWAVGELYIGGTGVAQGYWADPERTAASFITHPETGERLYRTGDLGRYLPDGTIEFLGRTDTQVKINGYRVELGEIEATLAGHPHVRTAVVTIQGSQLHAYLLLGTDESDVDEGEVAGFLAERLPDYMIPARFAVIDELPLTGNGKVDRSALAPLTAGDAEREIVPPGSPVEKLFLDIWRDVLGLDVIGVTERFAELGGDSMLGLQVIARASASGWRVTPQDFFTHPTIRELAGAAVEAGGQDAPADDGGPVPLSLMQRTFFAQDIEDPSHWNYAFLFELGTPLDAGVLRRAAAVVVGHHAGLRTGFVHRDGEWQAWIAGRDVAESVPVEVVRLTGLPPDGVRAAIEDIAADRQRRFDLDRPPLLRIVYFDGGFEARHRLLVLGHWLVWDNYSTRIFFDDLMSAYGQLAAGSPVFLPPVTTPLSAWLAELERHAHSPAVRSELDHWRRQASGAPIPTDRDGVNSLESVRTVVTALDPDRTAGLLAFAADTETSVADVLLTALASTVAGWAGGHSVLVDVEGHGREPLSADVDLSRTVGRLSVRYPLAIDLSECDDPAGTLAVVAARRAGVPAGGIGYGLLTRVSGDLVPAAAAPVCFNYLGRMDGMFRDEVFRLAAENPGPQHSHGGTRGHMLELLSAVVDGELVVGVSYSADLHDRATVDAFCDALLDAVADLVPARYATRVGERTSGHRAVSSVLRSWMDGGESR